MLIQTLAKKLEYLKMLNWYWCCGV